MAKGQQRITTSETPSLKFDVDSNPQTYNIPTMQRIYSCADCDATDLEKIIRRHDRMSVHLCATCFHKDKDLYSEDGEEYALLPVVFGRDKVEALASQVWQRESRMEIPSELRARMELESSEELISCYFISQFLYEKLYDVNPFCVEEAHGTYVYLHTERIPVWMTGDVMAVAYGILSTPNLLANT